MKKMGWFISLASLLVTTSAIAEPVKRVETKYVCMVNDQIFAKEQVPTEVEGKTYYGCCPMCASKLGSDTSLRHATDPISGKVVDKATAVVGATKDGSVHYFESNENLESFSKR